MSRSTHFKQKEPFLFLKQNEMDREMQMMMMIITYIFTCKMNIYMYKVMDVKREFFPFIVTAWRYDFHFFYHIFHADYYDCTFQTLLLLSFCSCPVITRLSSWTISITDKDMDMNGNRDREQKKEWIDTRGTNCASLLFSSWVVSRTNILSPLFGIPDLWKGL